MHTHEERGRNIVEWNPAGIMRGDAGSVGGESKVGWPCPFAGRGVM